MIGTFIFIACLIFDLVVQDFVLRFHYLFLRKNVASYYNKFQIARIRAIYKYAHVYTGFSINVESALKTRLPESFVILCNHQSLADILVVFYAFPGHFIKFVAKKSLKYGLPSISLGARIGKHAFINRKGDFKSTIRELKKLAKNTGEGRCPVIFPEGTRSRTGEVGIFHSAAVRVILENTNLPILSVAIGGGSRIVKFFDLFKHLHETRFMVKILNLHPHPRGRKEIKNVLEKAREEISRQVEEWKKEKKI
ncbi:MAG: 1-acyl-sn-glycerol-3-phosphate acyltransferase [Spirochaetes bacterium]|nr:1-acyl-sn-glycerol-3-phosphate acyltransferase [Spirochaetota bacterium]